MKEVRYAVIGMHCVSCETIIETKLAKHKGISEVRVSCKDQLAYIKYNGKKPTVNTLNQLFKSEGYTFACLEDKNTKPNEGFHLVITIQGLVEFLITVGVVGLVIIFFARYQGSVLSSKISITSKSSLPAFFVLGIVASLSTCAALVGGLVLSMSKQWAKNGLVANIMFQIGRLISFFVLGTLLGLLGQAVSLSSEVRAIFSILVALIMILQGLGMIGINITSFFKAPTPKFAKEMVKNDNKFKGKFMPFLLGAVTFILPCYFTITAQGAALASGNFMQGGLIMLAFALGTLPVLLVIGLTSMTVIQKTQFGKLFVRIAGILIVLFAFYSINGQLKVLGFTGFSQPSNVNGNQIQQGDLPPIVNGKQVIKMSASSRGYSPSTFKIRAGMPVRWEITNAGVSGCTKAIVSQSLFSGQIDIGEGIVVKEFTAPTKPGTYSFSCWMGMVWGEMQVVAN